MQEYCSPRSRTEGLYRIGILLIYRVPGGIEHLYVITLLFSAENFICHERHQQLRDSRSRLILVRVMGSEFLSQVYRILMSSAKINGVPCWMTLSTSLM